MRLHNDDAEDLENCRGDLMLAREPFRIVGQDLTLEWILGEV